VSFKRFVILLTLGWLGLFVLLPHLLVVLTSLLTADPRQLAIYPLTLESYRRLWEPIYAGVFWHSLWLSGLTTLVCVALGYPFAYIVARMPRGRRGLLLFLMVVPFWTNSLIRTYAIKALLGTRGLINGALLATGLVEQPLQLIYTEFAVIVGLVYLLLPFFVLPLIAGFDKLDPGLLEAARDLGAGAWRRFFDVVLPLTMPGVVAGCLIVFLPAMGMFYVSDLLGGARNLLLGNVIKNQFMLARDWPFGSAISVALILIMALLLWLYFLANRRIRRQGGLHDEVL